jgi:hypothetical protein
VAGLNGVGVQFGFYPRWKHPVGFRIASTFTPLELQRSPVSYSTYNLNVKLSGQFRLNFPSGWWVDYIIYRPNLPFLPARLPM